jgi:hypothetical protein
MDSKQTTQVLPKMLSNGVPLLQVRLHTVCDYGPIAGNNNLQYGVLKGIKMELVEAGVLLTHGKELVLIPMENVKMAVLK